MSELEPGNPYGVDVAGDAAGAGEQLVYVPVMLSPGPVAHYVAFLPVSKGGPSEWRPACGSGVELQRLDEVNLEGRKVTPCPQCQAWAREAQRLAN